jgi:hypothetical protein
MGRTGGAAAAGAGGLLGAGTAVAAAATGGAVTLVGFDTVEVTPALATSLLVSHDRMHNLRSAGHSTAPRSGKAANTCGHCSKCASQDAVQADGLSCGPCAHGSVPEAQPLRININAAALYFTTLSR